MKAFESAEKRHNIRRIKIGKKKPAAKPVSKIAKPAPKPVVNQWQKRQAVAAAQPPKKAKVIQTSPQQGQTPQPTVRLMPVCAPPVHTPPAPPTPRPEKRQKLNSQIALPRVNSDTLVTSMEECFVTSNGVVIQPKAQPKTETFTTSSGVVVSTPNKTSFKAPNTQLIPPVHGTTQPPVQDNSVRYYVVVNHGGCRYFNSALQQANVLAPYLTVVPTTGGFHNANNCVYVKSLENQNWLEIQNNGNHLAVETSIRGSQVFQVVTPRGCTFRSRPDMQSKVTDLAPAVSGNVYFAIRTAGNWVQIREGLWLPIKVSTQSANVDILRECISYDLNPSSVKSSPVAAPICAGSPPSVSISETPRKGNVAIQRPTPSLFNNSQSTRRF